MIYKEADREVISLGSLNLAQFEESTRTNEEGLIAHNDHMIGLESRKKIESDL